MAEQTANHHTEFGILAAGDGGCSVCPAFARAKRGDRHRVPDLQSVSPVWSRIAWSGIAFANACAVFDGGYSVRPAYTRRLRIDRDPVSCSPAGAPLHETPPPGG